MKSGIENPQKDESLECLRHALDKQRDYLKSYEKPCEPILYETLRTFDDLFCRDLMEPTRMVEKNDRLFRNLSTWGVNHALRRVVPRTPIGGPFRDFPSNAMTQGKADDFVFNCGVLALSERFEGWLEEGILKGELRPKPRPPGVDNVLVLRRAADSCFDEEVGQAGLRWAGALRWHEDRDVELALEKKHYQILPELEKRVRLVDGWRVTYSSSRQVDDYFSEWAKLYLRRMFSQDILDLNDSIGGRPFSRYLEILSALSARSQKHLAFAAILRARHPSAHIRNLLTTYCHRESFVESLAEYIGGDYHEVETILNSFILTGDNLDAHTQSGEMAWAPIAQGSTDMLILPTYGLDINPFLFLLKDFRYRYEADWFRVANNRERRWIGDFKTLFSHPLWRTHDRNLRLRDQGKDLTDIDFAAYNTKTNELALFQLKWQQPVGMDNRQRRSAGKNLIQESNKWIDTVCSWLEQHGVKNLVQRLGFESSCSPKINLFVLGRYNAYFSGYDGHDNRAVWSDWAHFRRVCMESKQDFSIQELVSRLRKEIELSRAGKGESSMFPIGNIAVVLEPTSVPNQNSSPSQS
jgi:hypothetical protein